ncbi:MAG: phage terminase large subunit [Spirochaetia bacterium]|jgi:PBSX family phage terminase large subunit|nr:phage terminase large subunit [Spirochaetia bacterium]
MFQKTAKQHEAIELMKNHIEVLLSGGSRSGKTFIAIYAVFIRALKYPNSRHLIVRRHFNHVKQTIWYQTFPDVQQKSMQGVKYKENKSDWFIQFPNGSQVWIAGTDDKERIEKILGSEWDTIYLNEASQLPFSTYELIKTRLNPGAGIKPLLLIDYNPPSMTHWGYVVFEKQLNYETKQPLLNKERYTSIKMNPMDNITNLSEGYIETLESMSESKRKRFLEGLYGDDSINAIWRRVWITDNRINTIPFDLLRVIIAVDPAVTGNETSDDTGIIVCAKYRIGKDIHFCVIGDYTYHGDITGWGQKVADLYKEFDADKVIGEVNQGGDLVGMNIRNYGQNIAYESVRATRGKAVRAEPIADLYRRGYVHHVGELVELEDQMATWTEEAGSSPDNMDALVWGLTFLAGIGTGQMSVVNDAIEGL